MANEIGTDQLAWQRLSDTAYYALERLTGTLAAVCYSDEIRLVNELAPARRWLYFTAFAPTDHVPLDARSRDEAIGEATDAVLAALLERGLAAVCGSNN